MRKTLAEWNALAFWSPPEVQVRRVLWGLTADVCSVAAVVAANAVTALAVTVSRATQRTCSMHCTHKVEVSAAIQQRPSCAVYAATVLQGTRAPG